MKENKKTPAPAVVRRMTTQEKVTLTSGINRWQTKEYPQYGIPSVFVADGPHGLRLEKNPNSPTDNEAEHAVCYPAACSLAASWDPVLLRRLGETLATECRAAGIDILLGPGVNIKRSPLCGRNFEYFSEDPHLAGVLGAAYIQGLQEAGVGACVKHFACNNQETERFTVSAEVDLRTLHEIYLRPFEMIIDRARPWSLMCAYNRVNGVLAAENGYLLDEVLRKRWRYRGVVISDWAAVNDKGASLAAGVDLQMPGPCGPFDTDVVSKIEAGNLPSEITDPAVTRLVELAARCGENAAKSKEAVSLNAHHGLARQMAAECIVLLKNRGPLLPLNRKHRRIAVIGAMAKTPRYQGGGSSHVNSFAVESPLEELKAACPWAEIRYAPGCDEAGHADAGLLSEAAATAAACDAAVLFIGLPESYESEGRDRKHMKLPAGHEALVREVAAAQPASAVFVMAGSAVELKDVGDCVPALLYGGLLGEGGGGAAAEVLTGKVNPCGKLAETFPLRLEDTPSFVNFPGSRDRVYYGERHYVGYRWYDACRKEVCYPFGHGLSYTSFEYADILLSAATISEGDGLTVECTVRNDGIRAGREIVQLYVRGGSSRVDSPEKELKGFCKVFLEAGESKRVSFGLESRDFSCYHPEREEWVCESGGYEILLGSSSADVRLRAAIDVESRPSSVTAYTRISRIEEILSAGESVRTRFFKQALELMDPKRVDEESFGGLLEFYRQRSVVKLLYWAGPDVTMDDLDRILDDVNGAV